MEKFNVSLDLQIAIQTRKNTLNQCVLALSNQDHRILVFIAGNDKTAYLEIGEDGEILSDAEFCEIYTGINELASKKKPMYVMVGNGHLTITNIKSAYRLIKKG